MANFWEGKRVLVTGGAGFIGSHLVEELVEKGARVTVTSQTGNTWRISEFLDKVRVLKGNLKEKRFCEEIVKGQEILFHLAAISGGFHYRQAIPVEVLRDNLTIFFNTIDEAIRAKIQKIIVLSSVKAANKELVMHSTDSYPLAKFVIERACEMYRKEYGAKITIARACNTYGPKDDFDPEKAQVIPALIARVMQGENPLLVWGSGNEKISLIYCKDLVKALLLLTEKFHTSEPWAVCSGTHIRIKDLAKLIVDLSGKNIKIKFKELTNPQYNNTNDPSSCGIYNISRFTTKFSLEQGLKETLLWYQEYKKYWKKKDR